MVKQWFLRNGVFVILILYIVMGAYILYQMNFRMGYIIERPVRITREAREMVTRLREMQNTLPSLFSNPAKSYDGILSVLEAQEKLQNKSFDIIKDLFRGDPKYISDLAEELQKLRRLRREGARETIDNHDYNVAMAVYDRKIEPQVDIVGELITTIGNLAQESINREKAQADDYMKLGIFLMLFCGLLIAVFFYFLRRKEMQRTEQLLYRDKLFDEFSYNVDEIFLIASSATQFSFVTSNSERIIGVKADYIIAHPEILYKSLPPQEAEWLKENLEEHKYGKVTEREMSLDDGARSFKITLTALTTGHDVFKGTLVAIRDQTRDAEQKQALTDALKNAHAASKAKSNFLSHMSHEIRTPMNAIIGMTTIAQNKMNNPVRVMDCLNKISESSHHLLGLINDVLDMSKIENGKLSITNEPFSLPKVIQSLNDLIRPQAEARDLKFDIIQDNVEQDYLIGDALRLNQILLNILSNALKFTPAGGRITVQIRQLSLKHNNVRLRFVITDTGIGMSEEFLHRLYRPFEQATRSTTAKYGGTGLGMSITMNLITLMGGAINVESREGEGSKFSIEIPFVVNDKRLEGRETLPQLKVMVVDDDADTCEHAALLMEKMGLTVHWCTKGMEAVRQLSEAKENGVPFDVCLLDWKMPELDGMETARRIRTVVGDELILIIITAFDSAPLEEEAQAVGIDDFIVKPLFASTLFDALIATTHRRDKGEDNAEGGDCDIDLSDRRILLVEDNEFNREIGNEFLEMANATVENAENGQEALDMFMASEAGYYDLILMDIQMPVMDGYEASRAIRASTHPDAKSIRIVAMTANAFSEDVAAAASAGMNGHIPKPIDIKGLYKTLQAHLLRPKERGQ